MEFNNRFVWNHKTSGPCNVCLSGYPVKCDCGGRIHSEMCWLEEDLALMEATDLYVDDADDEEHDVTEGMIRTVVLQCDKCGVIRDLGPVSEEVEKKLSQPIARVIERVILEERK